MKGFTGTARKNVGNASQSSSTGLGGLFLLDMSIILIVDHDVWVIAGKEGGMMGRDPVVGNDHIPLGFAELYASPGDHVGHFYQTPEESHDLVVGFLKTRQDFGEKCVYLGPPDETRPFSEAMAGGIDVANVIHQNPYFEDPEVFLEALRRRDSTALAP